MISQSDIEATFPEFDRIEDEELREKTIQAWLNAIEQSSHEDLKEIPWSPGFDQYLGEQRYIDHISETVQLSIALAEAVERVHDVGVDMDIIVSGALVHDIDKILTYESIGNYDDPDDAETDIGHLIQHPQYAVHLLSEIDMPLAIQHIAISHSGSTPVKHETLEAKIVTFADLMAAHARFWDVAGHFMPGH